MSAAVPSSAATTRPAPFRRRPLLAMQALRRLIADPERTEDVFVILQHLSGDSLQRGYNRFAQVPARLPWLGHSMVEVLSDRDRLRGLPAGSLGRAYLEFVEREDLSADGLVEASEVGRGSEDAAVDGNIWRYGERNRDTHDLWHVLTGYGRDTFGEACLLGFTYAQTEDLGIGVIAFVGALKIAKETRRLGVIGAIWQGYRAGRRAAWLPGENWVDLLSEPLEALRTRLNIASPTRYREVRALITAAA